MKHPIHFILFGAGACMTAAVVLFVTGIFAKAPTLKTTGCWFAIAALVIACLPLIAIFVMVLLEKLRRK